MTETELLILNFEEIRRRSIKIWTSIPEEQFHWRPDKEAMSIQEMIRHVLEGEYLYHRVILHRGSPPTYDSPYQNRNFHSVEDELAFAQPYREQFLQTVRSFTASDLTHITIDRRSDAGYVRTLGDMLLRIAYHEAVHTGQLLDYLRSAGLERPLIWD